MQAKIINKTTLTKREIIVSQLLNNRFLMIIYAITLLLFIIIRIFSVINGINISTTQTVLSVLIIIVCLGVILYPFFNAIREDIRNYMASQLRILNIISLISMSKSSIIQLMKKPRLNTAVSENVLKPRNISQSSSMITQHSLSIKTVL